MEKLVAKNNETIFMVDTCWFSLRKLVESLMSMEV